MYRFRTLFLALPLASLFMGCSPKLAPLTADNSSVALPAGTPYALVHLYRPGKMVGFLIGYDVHANDTVVYRARNGSKGEYRQTTPGRVTLWAKTEAREELTLDVQPGREYYVRCTIGMGAVVGRPHFQQVAVGEGRKETASISGK